MADDKKHWLSEDNDNYWFNPYGYDDGELPSYRFREPELHDDNDVSSGIINSILLNSHFKHNPEFDCYDNLPIMFGTETELALHFGKVLDPKKEYMPAANFLEALFPFFLRKVSEMTKAFARDPGNPWLRSALDKFSGEQIKHHNDDLIKMLTPAAIDNDPDKLPGELKDIVKRVKMSPKDYYLGEVGVFLPNGGRLYVDGAHLENSIAECRSPREVICYEKAVEALLMEALPEIQKYIGREIFLFKDNTDRKGNSYSCHENFLLMLPFFKELYAGGLWTQAWTTFLVTSLIYTGAGKVGHERGEPCDYQISQRADHFYRLIGMDTMKQRPIINYRGEALADDEKWGRFHVILSDSNMAEWPNFLKLSTKALVLNMMQAHYFGKVNNDPYSKFLLSDPVKDLPKISRDLTCQNSYCLKDRGEQASPIEIQKVWLESVKNFYLHSGRYYPCWVREVIDKWEKILAWLYNDDPELNSVLDWRIKEHFIKHVMTKRSQKGETLTWQSPEVASLDWQYHNLSKDGYYNKMLARGTVQRIVTDSDIAKARDNAPEDTRAWARSQFIKHYLGELLDVSWELVVIKLKLTDDFEPIVKIDLRPLRGTRLTVKNIFSRHDFKSFCREYLEQSLNGLSPF